MNTGALWPSLEEAEPRVLAMQTKLHRWAVADPGRRFDDLYNLVHDSALLVVAWNRVRVNKGARTAGVDRVAPRAIPPGAGALLEGVGASMREGRLSTASVGRVLVGGGELGSFLYRVLCGSIRFDWSLLR